MAALAPSPAHVVRSIGSKTEINESPEFYYAEDYQLYLDKVVNSQSHAGKPAYCPIHSTGVTLPDDFAVTPLQYADSASG